MKYLADMGPQGAGYVATFVSMTDEELEKANELFGESLMLPYETANNIMGSYQEAGENAVKGLEEGITSGSESVAEATENVGLQAIEGTYKAWESVKGTYYTGENFISGLIEGIMDNEKNAVNAGEKVGTDTSKALNNVLMIKSPSRKTYESGKYFIEGLRLGIDENENRVLTVIKSLARNALNITDDGFATSEYAEIGRQVTEGLRQGIESGRNSVISSIVAMCQAAINSAKTKLDIHSPSKAFSYLGEMSGEGYITGWEQTMNDIDNIIADTFPDFPSGTKNNIAGAQAVTGISIPDTLPASVEKQNERMFDICEKMLGIMSQYMPEMANMQMVTDTGALIGELVPGMDEKLAVITSERNRGIM